MDDSLPNVEQQISETYVEQKIKIEPEAEQDPLEYVNVTVKSERVENCEPELDELNPPEYINVPVKSEVFESCEPESVNTEDSTHTLFCNELNEKQNVVDSSNYNETEDHCIINKNIDITKPCKDKELSNNPNKGGSSKRRCGKDDCPKQAYKGIDDTVPVKDPAITGHLKKPHPPPPPSKTSISLRSRLLPCILDALGRCKF
uniref:Uncharacterized protein n=1 Tax=Timema tahoe TaxID=61484 RepID=A0A7R9INE0_9NEOP|nr:unnamed protein product [Timema tahoe]